MAAGVTIMSHSEVRFFLFFCFGHCALCTVHYARGLVRVIFLQSIDSDRWMTEAV